jgi:seryl-tRNA synthetase
MLQIAFIRENQEKVIQALAKGIWTPKVLWKIIKLDTERRAAQVELDGILAESNKLSKDIGEMMKNGEKSKAAILKEKSFK